MKILQNLVCFYVEKKSDDSPLLQEHSGGRVWACGGGVLLHRSQHLQTGPLAHPVPHHEAPPPQLDLHPVHGPDAHLPEMVRGLSSI